MRLALIALFMIPLTAGCASEEDACISECEDDYEECSANSTGDSVCKTKLELCQKSCSGEDRSGAESREENQGSCDDNELDAAVRAGTKMPVWIFVVLGFLRRRYTR